MEWGIVDDVNYAEFGDGSEQKGFFAFVVFHYSINISPTPLIKTCRLLDSRSISNFTFIRTLIY